MAAAAAVHQRRPRHFRPRKDALNDLTNEELIRRYRLDREGILFVTDLVRDAISPHTARNKAIPPELKVITTLRYLATGKMQQCSSDDLGPSQQTISRIIKETVYALSTLDILRRFIKFPRTPQEAQVKTREFWQLSRLSGIVGDIDGIHVRIVAPRSMKQSTSTERANTPSTSKKCLTKTISFLT